MASGDGDEQRSTTYGMIKEIVYTKKCEDATARDSRLYLHRPTARCYAERGYATVCRVSVRPPDVQVYGDQIGILRK